MWSYYGRKTKVIKYYPKPTHDIIIEPFAGTAVYALHENNWQREVILIDKYEVITEIWEYLQAATPKEILSLPTLVKGEKVEDFECLSEAEKYLIGFCVNRGNPQPCKTANNYNSWESDKKRIAENLYKIKHWDIRCGDYDEFGDINAKTATWFIDPPYQEKGYKYKHSCKNIDFGRLADWSKERNGQVIVCENMGANWLDFKTLKSMRGVNGKNIEAVYVST